MRAAGRGRAVNPLFAVMLSLAHCAALAVEVEVTTLDGTQTAGKLITLAPELSLDAAGGPLSLDWSEVYELRPLGQPPEAAQPGANPLRFELADGSRFGGRVDGARDGEFCVRFRSGQTIWLPRAGLRSIIAAGAGEQALASLMAVPEAELAKDDVAVVAREDRTAELRGEARNLAGEGVTFLWRDREVLVPWDRLVGIRFRTPAEREGSMRVQLHDGDVFVGRIVGGGDEAVVLQSGSLERLPIAWARIARVEVRSDRLVYLSDAQPAEVEFESLLDRRWSPGFDRSLTGKPIVLAGRTYEKGIVVHSRTSLAWRIGGRFSRFAATVGVVDEAGPIGAVRMAVIGDGGVLWEAEVRAGQPPMDIQVDLKDVGVLQLLVDYGPELDLGDHAAWAEPRLIR